MERLPDRTAVDRRCSDDNYDGLSTFGLSRQERVVIGVAERATRAIIRIGSLAA